MAPPVSELKAMTDAFEGIDRLAEGAPRTDGAPNFRRVSSSTERHDLDICYVTPYLYHQGNFCFLFFLNST